MPSRIPGRVSLAGSGVPFLVVLCSCALGPACHGQRDPAPQVQATHTPSPTQVRPPVPPSSITPTVTDEATGEGMPYRLYRWQIPLRGAQLGFLDLRFQTSLEEALQQQRATLVINGGYWNPEREPEGLSLAGEVRFGAFDPELGGGVLVTKDGRGELLDAEAEDFSLPEGLDFALQCRPRLVVDGERNIERDTGRRANRTALCLRDAGRTLDVVVAKSPGLRAGPTLYELANLLVGRGCEQALNLDGGPSTGVAWREGGQVRSVPSRTPVRLAVLLTLDE